MRKSTVSWTEETVFFWYFDIVETERSPGLNRQQHLLIAAAIWILVGTGLLIMGCIFWFHFPYLGFVDKEHIGFGSLALVVGLLKGKFVLEKTAVRTIERANALTETNPVKSIIQMFGGKTIALILAMMGIGIILRAAGVSFEIRGLIYIAVGTALLWSCQRYLVAARG
ncbi:hypothetical protein [Chamaesiphon minutus]|uniref:hypothetical protein n=1 Tax=Chamaesiphon minutus TaxID=1173032 RepID=UPI001E5ADE23|nr:hypothetical protein [Chamaesiphon minutus]